MTKSFNEEMEEFRKCLRELQLENSTFFNKRKRGDNNEWPDSLDYYISLPAGDTIVGLAFTKGEELPLEIKNEVMTLFNAFKKRLSS